MKTDELERHLRRALRETLDRELGPDPTWAESPAARRVAELDRSRRRWPLRVLGIAALIGAGGGAALLAGAPHQPAEYANGRIAFAVAQEDPAGGGPDTDIWFAALGQEPRRVIGTDTDGIDQVCPAFSPDGRSLAYGSIEGIRSTPPGAARLAAYRNSALVIADVADDSTVAERLSIDVGDGLPPPCPVWSPDGDQLAFGVPRTSPINPDQSGEGSEIWIMRPADGEITVIPDLLATDLEWSPDGSLLAIAGGVETASGEGVIDGLQDARIHLYEPSTGTLRTLDDTLGVDGLTWSPDGGRIAYAGGPPTDEGVDWTRRTLWVIDVETGQQEVLTDGYRAIHGIGPVWSPDGETIAYQRSLGEGERHEVVLVTPDDRSEQTGLASEVVMPSERTTADGSSLELWPWRVTWSPDGTYLLYVAWTYPNETVEQTVVVAVPTDPDAPAVLLADVDGIAAYDFADVTMRVPIQIWQRRPADAAAPTLTTEPSSSAQVSPTLARIDTSSWLPYVSERYGFSIAYPTDWSAYPADRDWTFPEDTAWPDGMLRTDWFYFEPAPDTLGVAVSAWSVALESGTSADQWFLDYCGLSVTPCDGTEPAVAASLDGNEGSLVLSSNPHAYFAVGDRIYLMAIWQPEDFVTLERYGGARRLLEAFLSTMRLLPGQQSITPSSPAPT